MQNSQLFRRGVVLPLDEDAENRLRTNNVNDATHVRHLNINDLYHFEEIWAAGVFQKINERTDGLIDDYEEDFVEVSSLIKLEAAVKEMQSRNYTRNVEAFLASLSLLISEAKSLSRPLLFVL